MHFVHVKKIFINFSNKLNLLYFFKKVAVRNDTKSISIYALIFYLAKSQCADKQATYFCVHRRVVGRVCINYAVYAFSFWIEKEINCKQISKYKMSLKINRFGGAYYTTVGPACC